MVGGGAGLGMIQMHYIYCALFLSSNTSTDLTGGTGLWPRGWGSLDYRIFRKVSEMACRQNLQE